MNIKVAYCVAYDVQVYLDYLYQFKSYKHGRNNIKEELLKIYPEEFRVALNKAPNRLEATKVIKNYLKNKYQGKRVGFNKVCKVLEEAWIKQGSDVERQLVNLFNQQIPFDNIYVFITTAPICPYNFKKKEIMITCRVPVEAQINILKHELNHFMFYYYFPELKNNSERERYESLKEALTVFTNPKEKGYPNQHKLRAWLKTQKKSIPEIIKSGKWEKYL